MDKIRNEHKSGASVQENHRKTTEVVAYRRVRRMKEEQLVRRMLDVDIPRKKR